MIKRDTLIIFSSVLHEVEDYWFKLKHIIEKTGATLAIRDMRFSAHIMKISKQNLAKLIKHANPQHLSEFTAKYGLFTDKDMYHFLLKYSYVDNWELELEEDYFCFNYQNLLSLGKVIYQKNYTLKYKKERVKEDFDINLTKPTHTMLIIKVKDK